MPFPQSYAGSGARSRAVIGGLEAVAAVYIYGQIEAGNPQAAAGISVVLLALAFDLTLVLDMWQTGPRRRRQIENGA